MNDYTSIGKPPQCPYCGAMPHRHIEQCPQIVEVEYYPDGTVKSVEKR